MHFARSHFATIHMYITDKQMVSMTGRGTISIIRNSRVVHARISHLQASIRIDYFDKWGIFFTLLKPHMLLKLLTSIRFQKNLRTSPEKLTYGNIAKNQPYVAAVANGCYGSDIRLL